MLDIAILASTVVGKYLVPVLKTGWDKFFDATADKAGDAVASQTKQLVGRIWQRVRDAFAADPGKKAVLDQFEQKPEEAAPLIESMLRDLLANDKALATELNGLLEQHPDGRGGDQIIADTVYHLTANNAHVESGGIIANVVTGANLQPPTRPRPMPPPRP